MSREATAHGRDSVPTGWPDPCAAVDLDELADMLRVVKVLAGDPSYSDIARRVNRLRGTRAHAEHAGRSTIYGYFQRGRARFREDMLADIVAALCPLESYVHRWRHALRMVHGDVAAGGFVPTRSGLPDDEPGFVGRRAELARLHELMVPGNVVVIHGMPGVGKTRLALHAAHQAAQRFPGIQLFADLRGYDPVAPQAHPSPVLADLLKHLGMAPARIPARRHDRIDAYRRMLHGRRALIVLDNAPAGAGVRALLPQDPGCLTLITSRNTLDDVPGAHCVRLGELAPADAIDLLRQTAGEQRIAADPALAGRIVELLGLLPLAISVVGGHMRAHPEWPLADYPQALASLAMAGGVRTAIALSDRRLRPPAGRLLRLMAVQPCADLAPATAAALAGQTVPATVAQLRELTAAHLVQEHTPGRYQLHDLVAHYGAERCGLELPASVQLQALRDMCDHLRATAAVAVNLLDPCDGHARPAFAAPEPDPGVEGARQARAWLDGERVNLLAVAAAAGARGWPGYAVDLARLLHRYFDLSGHYATAVALGEQALKCVQEAGSVACEPAVRSHLAWMYWRQGQTAAATRQLSRALAVARSIGDRAQVARTLGIAGNVAATQGNHRKAVRSHRASLAIHRELGLRAEQANEWNNLGTAYRGMGRLDEALEAHRCALELARAGALRRTESLALMNTGIVLLLRGHAEKALDPLDAALHIAEGVGDQPGGAAIRNALGHAYRALGRPVDAMHHFRRSLAIARSIGDRGGEAGTLNGLGEVLRDQGRTAQALASHEAALGVAADAGIRSEEASAHLGLGNVHGDMGNRAQACRHWTEALRLHPDRSGTAAAEIRARLALMREAALG